MPDLFINKLSDLSDKYSIKYDDEENSKIDDSVNHNGKQYKHIGLYEKKCSFNDLIYLVFEVLYFSFSPAYSSATSFKENLKVLFMGKEIGKIYCDQDELEEVDTKIHRLGKKLPISSPGYKEPVQDSKKLSPQPFSSPVSSPILKTHPNKTSTHSLDQAEEVLQVASYDKLARWLKDSAKAYPGQYPGNIGQELLNFIKHNPNDKVLFFKYIDDLHKRIYPGLFIGGQGAYHLKKEYEKLFPLDVEEELPQLDLEDESYDKLAKWLEHSAKAYLGQYPGNVGQELLSFIKHNPNDKVSFFEYIDDLHNHIYPNLFIGGQGAYHLKKEYEKLFPLATQKKLEVPSDQIKVQTSQIDIQSLSFAKYQAFILQNEKVLHPNKRQLLENTVLHANSHPSNSLTYQIVSVSDENFKKLLNAKIQDSKACIECTDKWFDYTDPHSYWVDFANATSFGGGYKRRGNVQEETMFCEFPDLAYLDYAVNGNIHPCKEGHLFCPTDATPFIIKNITRQWKVNPALYGRKLENEDFKGQISESGILIENVKNSHGQVIKTANKGQAIERLKNQPPISIIGLAAIDWGKIPATQRKYQMNHLEYHLKAAYLGNIGAKQNSKGRISIHTSNWGCGAFDNSNKMMVAIQILAAKMADVDLVFHGTNGFFNPDYSDKMITDMQELIQANLDQGKTAADILKLFLDNQAIDSQWAPKLPK